MVSTLAISDSTYSQCHTLTILSHCLVLVSSWWLTVYCRVKAQLPPTYWELFLTGLTLTWPNLACCSMSKHQAPPTQELCNFCHLYTINHFLAFSSKCPVSSSSLQRVLSPEISFQNIFSFPHPILTTYCPPGFWFSSLAIQTMCPKDEIQQPQTVILLTNIDFP